MNPINFSSRYEDPENPNSPKNYSDENKNKYSFLISALDYVSKQVCFINQLIAKYYKESDSGNKAKLKINIFVTATKLCNYCSNICAYSKVLYETHDAYGANGRLRDSNDRLREILIWMYLPVSDLSPIIYHCESIIAHLDNSQHPSPLTGGEISIINKNDFEAMIKLILVPAKIAIIFSGLSISAKNIADHYQKIFQLLKSEVLMVDIENYSLGSTNDDVCFDKSLNLGLFILGESVNFQNNRRKYETLINRAAGSPRIHCQYPVIALGQPELINQFERHVSPFELFNPSSNYQSILEELLEKVYPLIYNTSFSNAILKKCVQNHIERRENSFRIAAYINDFLVQKRKMSPRSVNLIAEYGEFILPYNASCNKSVLPNNEGTRDASIAASKSNNHLKL